MTLKRENDQPHPRGPRHEQSTERISAIIAATLAIGNCVIASLFIWGTVDSISRSVDPLLLAGAIVLLASIITLSIGVIRMVVGKADAAVVLSFGAGLLLLVEIAVSVLVLMRSSGPDGESLGLILIAICVSIGAIVLAICPPTRRFVARRSAQRNVRAVPR